MAGGFQGKLLRVDLARAEFREEAMDMSAARRFLGSKGYAAQLLYRELAPGTDPLSPLNRVVIMTGPLTGVAGAPMPNRFSVCTRSPLSGTWVNSHCGGHFGPELKFAGWDGIVLEGRADHPAHLRIRDSHIELVPAAHLWGKGTFETMRMIQSEEVEARPSSRISPGDGKGRNSGPEDLRPSFPRRATPVFGEDDRRSSNSRNNSEEGADKRLPHVLSIGPAGENLSRIAAVIADVRAAGRGGTGAVLGSKNLKAISVAGAGRVPLADEALFSTLAKEAREKLVASQGLKDRKLEGTASNVRPVHCSGGLPTRNFQFGKFEGFEEIAGDAFGKHLWNNSKNLRPCWGCVTPSAHYAVLSEKGAGCRVQGAGTEPSSSYLHPAPCTLHPVVDEGPEYETVVMNGSNLGISDREAIAYADYLMDDYGLDTISFGNTLGFLIECYQKGLIGDEETGGIPLAWGDTVLLHRAIGLAAKREGPLGALLADGVARAATKIGRGSAAFAMHVKGLELPAYDPRQSPGQALAYAVSDRGACHLRPFMYSSEHFGKSPRLDPTVYEGRGKEVKSAQERSAMNDSLGVCKFYVYGLSLTKDMIPLVNAATGFDYSSEEFLLVGERINNLTRLFNAREGFDAKDDALPARCRTPPAEGRRAGMPMDIRGMLAEYYRECGWDQEGVPTEERLRSLGLDGARRRTGA